MVRTIIQTNSWLTVLLAGFFVLVLFLFTGLPASQASALEDKSTQRDSRVILEIKFKDGSDIEARGNKFVGTGADEVNDALNKAKIQKSGRLFTRAENELKREYRELREKNKKVADLSQYYTVHLNADADIEAIANQLEALPVVEHAYAQPRPVQPPASPSYVYLQTYRQAAPTGVDANGVSSWPGATGSKVKMIDMEYNWNLTHEDISKARISAFIPNGNYADPFDDTNHGTAALGILSADSNTFGITGIARDAALGVVNAYNTDGYLPANGIDVARATMSAGDVLLLEQQIDGPAGGTTDYVPLEWIPSVYDAIRYATADNIIVVEAGGNGGQNLNDSSLFGAPFPDGKPDSGAIVVGAGGACAGGTTPRNARLAFSTYGSRVNMQGNGECVATTGYGNLYSAGGINAYYTNAFNGTSSASAIVAGVAAAFSSAYEQLNGVAPSASFVRSTLAATGTPQNVGAGTLGGTIGPLPNLPNALPYTDLTAPSTPTLQSVSLDWWYRKPVLRWSAAADNVAVTGYKIYRNNILITTVTPRTSWTDSSAPKGTQRYQVSAIDKAGRESVKSNTISINVP